MNKQIRLKIDGLEIQAEEGTTILQAAIQNNIYIPNLCYHQDLEAVGVCRLCMVEVDGSPRLTVACKTPIVEAMNIKTDSPSISNVRKTSLKLLLKNHHEDCSGCPKNSNCELQNVADYVGVTHEELNTMRAPETKVELDQSNPFFERDMNKCIACGICVRTCEEILGVSAIGFVNRGYDTVIGTFGNKPLKDSTCVACGECMVRCPVGALNPRTHEKPAREVNSICTYCGCGCGITFGVRGEKIVSAKGDRKNPASKGNLCVKGRFGYDFVNSKERLTKPLIKQDGKFVETDWNTALDFVAKGLSKVKGDITAVLSSAKCTNEDNYVIQKFTRAVVGTNNIDHCARL